ncbi:Na(+)-translocating NADH-quinone reductase subunit A [Serratia fonticola]|uniref:Na(+)-translocating NADH-quinone reductase subunit A n=1 Tax=Serratia fonticola TaxID=47917 RepID=A0A4U9TSX4_SERFO|nr:Na(+)-translocating NADH-quinone reductase subunit A [Serratia fonticola]
MARLTDGKVQVCHAAGTRLDNGCWAQIDYSEFAGPHPAGLVGTHIHFLEAGQPEENRLHIGYQDVIAIGTLFTTGKLDTQRVVALAGPQVEQPVLLRTRLGASLDQLTAGRLKAGEKTG